MADRMRGIIDAKNALLSEIKWGVIKAAPAGAGVTVATTAQATTLAGDTYVAGGLTLNEWAAAATIAYVVLQFAYTVWKWIREARKL